MECKNICPICLRTNRKLNLISTLLSQYHKEITDHTLQCKDLRYCSDCEWMLRKTYNFIEKCCSAAKILNDWINETVMDKTSAHLLYLKLPPTNLGIWTSKNNKVFDLTSVEEVSEQKEIIMTKSYLPNKPDMYTFLERSVTNDEDKESEMIDVKPFQLDFHCKINEMPNISRQNYGNTENVFGNKIDTEDNLNQLCLDNNDEKNDIIVIDDDDEYPDDASLNSNDDCDDHLYPPPVNKKIVRQTLDELANISLSDDDLDDDYKNNTTISSDEEKWISTERTIMSKLGKIDKSLDSICNNWEATSLLTDLRVRQLDDQTKDKVKKAIHNFLTERKTFKSGTLKNVKNFNVLTKIERLKSDLDWINEQCAKTVEGYELNPTERLKAVLNRWGELRTMDGSVFNKDIIINCLDKAPANLITDLLKLMQGKKRLSSGAARTLTMIQNSTNNQLAKYESVFDIEFLNTEIDKLEEFQRRKTYECYVTAKYKCEICYQGFKNAGQLDYHTKTKHDESKGQFTCRFCHVTLALKRQAVTHSAFHRVVYKCKLCPLITYYKGSMKNHYEQHQGTIYKCDKCDHQFKSKSMYLFHQSRTHPSIDSVCTICGYGFVSQHGLFVHMQKKHLGASPVPASGSSYSCVECPLTFSSDAARQRHQRRAHALKTTRHEYRPRPYKSRLLTKKGVKRVFPCPQCKATGGGYGWLVKHYKLEHPTLDVKEAYAHIQHLYLCDICGKKFRFKTYLRQHLNVHSGIMHPCPICDKQFAKMKALRQHEDRHYPPRYSCEQCGKKFHSSSNLYNHKQFHIGDRRYKCHICSKGFMHKNTLNEHIRGVHNHERRRRVKKQEVRRKLSTVNNFKFDMRLRRRVKDTSNKVTDTLSEDTYTSKEVTDTSNDITDTSNEVTDTLIAVTDTSNGAAGSKDVSDTESFEIGAEVDLY